MRGFIRGADLNSAVEEIACRSETRAWSSEYPQRYSCKVNVPSWQAVPTASENYSLRNDLGRVTIDRR